MSQIPLLLVGDAPTAGTGLGRITGDIASRVTAHLSDSYRVATFGYGGVSSRSLPFHHYVAEGMYNWVMPTLPEIWNDWAGKDKGIVMFVSDPARNGWFSRPEMSAELAKWPGLQQFLKAPPFQKVIYAPVDAGGPNDRLTFPLQQSLLGFDRILAYGKFGEDTIRQTLGEQESEKRHLTSLPHGIDDSVFYPRNRQTSRAFFFAITGAENLYGKRDLIKPDELLIGCVCTNQSRKDVALLVEAVSILSRHRKVRLWLHTDVLERAWSIPALLVDHGLIDRTVISLTTLSDDAMAKAYSACDVTIAPGPEGFGYPIAESLACGTPCVTGAYAGGAELVTPLMRVPPLAFRYESVWACKRPVYDPAAWADKAEKWSGQRFVLDHKYDWANVWPEWESWFRETIQ